MDLIISEKPIAARRIAEILSGGKMSSRARGEVVLHEFDPGDRVAGGKGTAVVVGLKGHVMGVDFPKRLKRWTLDMEGLIGTPPERVPLKKAYVEVLRSLAPEADRVVIATDYDREGELIGVEALEAVRKGNPSVPVTRARFSAITPAEIHKAFRNLADVDFNLAAASSARQTIDLVWGAALTRFISLASRRLGSEFLSVGRVQSPTLALLVERDAEVSAFRPLLYWEIKAHLKGGLEVRHARRFEYRRWGLPLLELLDLAAARGEAERALARVGSAKQATVSKVRTSEREEKPPPPFHTTEFLRAANALGLSAPKAMSVAEDLYMNGLISYPRTDNTVYPAMEFRPLLELIGGMADYAAFARALLGKPKLVPVRGEREATDHPPIHPVGVPKAPLAPEARKVYDLVVRRFLATLSDPSRVKRVRADLDIGGEPFAAEGTEVLVPGWRAIYPFLRIEEKRLPPLAEGQAVPVAKSEREEKQTQPPKRYSQGSLIKKMEDLGLGTKSTRHETLAKLFGRSYVSGKDLRPSARAKGVVETLAAYAPAITKPEMTRLLEEEMDRIAAGQKREEDVVQESREMLRGIFKELQRDRVAIGEALQKRIGEGEQAGKCPTCGAALAVKRSRKGGRFLGCSAWPNCNFAVSLPRTGALVLLPERCATHPIRLAEIRTKGRKPWKLGCPYCSFLEWSDQRAKRAAGAASPAGAAGPAPRPTPGAGP
ncbi:MAG: DNA topoisomerase I [Halobacteria archaeon]